MLSGERLALAAESGERESPGSQKVGRSAGSSSQGAPPVSRASIALPVFAREIRDTLGAGFQPRTHLPHQPPRPDFEKWRIGSSIAVTLKLLPFRLTARGSIRMPRRHAPMSSKVSRAGRRDASTVLHSGSRTGRVALALPVEIYFGRHPHTVVRVCNPGRDGPATHGVVGRRIRSRRGRVCGSTSTFSSREADPTFPSSR